MSDTLHIDDHLQAEEELLIFLRNKNYKRIMRFLDAQYRFRFCTEISGATFESCIDWCAENAGNVDDAKDVLLRLFGKFYRHLPIPVKQNLVYLAKEIGYHPLRSIFCRFKDLYREMVGASRPALASIMMQIRQYVAERRLLSGPSREEVIAPSPVVREASFLQLIESSET